ncbi:ResB-like domain [Dillenia turbinata]|uniref:ResB-like domain n=1 Tax=Dillenia turbinata TaxID=194707 RepID=A0AAN8YXB8_9MAGN
MMMKSPRICRKSRSFWGSLRGYPEGSCLFCLIFLWLSERCSVLLLLWLWGRLQISTLRSTQKVILCLGSLLGDGCSPLDLTLCSPPPFFLDCALSWLHHSWLALIQQQTPLVKNFWHTPETIRKQECTDTLPRAAIQDLGVVLMGDGYEVHRYCCHAFNFFPFFADLVRFLLLGTAEMLKCAAVILERSTLYAFRGSVTVPQGLNFVVGDVFGPISFLSSPTDAFNTEVHVNRFYYYDGREVSADKEEKSSVELAFLLTLMRQMSKLYVKGSQFHTDLSLSDLNGKEVLRKTVSVNDPLRYGGITMYQTDWSISALQILKDDE